MRQKLFLVLVPEAQSDHAVHDEVDARVEDETEDVEARQDPDGDGRMEATPRLAVVEVTSPDRRRVDDRVNLGSIPLNFFDRRQCDQIWRYIEIQLT